MTGFCCVLSYVSLWHLESSKQEIGMVRGEIGADYWSVVSFDNSICFLVMVVVFPIFFCKFFSKWWCFQISQMLFCIFSSKFFKTQLYVQVTKYHERLVEQMLNAIAQFTSAIDHQRFTRKSICSRAPINVLFSPPRSYCWPRSFFGRCSPSNMSAANHCPNSSSPNICSFLISFYYPPCSSVLLICRSAASRSAPTSTSGSTSSSRLQSPSSPSPSSSQSAASPPVARSPSASPPAARAASSTRARGRRTTTTQRWR